MDPKIAERAPVACAGCYGQYPDRIHVDFKTQIDGPVLDVAHPRTSRVDWVVLCENCVRRAASLLPDDQHRLEVERLNHQLTAATERAEEAERYADDLEQTLRHRPQSRPKAPAAPKGGPARKSRYQRTAA